MIGDGEEREGQRHADEVEGRRRGVGERALDEDERGAPDGDHEDHQQVGAEFHVF